MKKNLSAIAILITATCLFAFQNCSTPPENNDEDNSSSNVSPVEAFKQSLVGIWVRDCQYHSTFGTYYQQFTTITKAGNSLLVATQNNWHSAAGCAATSLYMVEDQVRQVLSLTQTSGNNEWILSGNLISQNLTMKTAAVVAYHNSHATCGFTGYILNQAHSSLGTACQNPTTTQDVMAVNSNFLFRSLDEVLAPTVSIDLVVKNPGYRKAN